MTSRQCLLEKAISTNGAICWMKSAFASSLCCSSNGWENDCPGKDGGSASLRRSPLTPASSISRALISCCPTRLMGTIDANGVLNELLYLGMVQMHLTVPQAPEISGPVILSFLSLATSE